MSYQTYFVYGDRETLHPVREPHTLRAAASSHVRRCMGNLSPEERTAGDHYFYAELPTAAAIRASIERDTSVETAVLRAALTMATRRGDMRAADSYAAELRTFPSQPFGGSGMSEQATYDAHWHVATGLAGYGPDGSDGFACFSSLAGALEYAREELLVFIDMSHEVAHALAGEEDYAGAWREIVRCEDLESWRANLDPARASAPLYAGDPAAYAAMQDEQAAQFPRDVSHNTRLYLWQCEEPAECEHCEED